MNYQYFQCGQGCDNCPAFNDLEEEKDSEDSIPTEEVEEDEGEEF